MLDERKLLAGLAEVARLGGLGHLVDMREAIFGTTKRRVLGGHDVQAYATELVRRGWLRYGDRKRDRYFITEAGRAALDRK